MKALQSEPAFDVTIISRHGSTATFPAGARVVKVSNEYPKTEMVDAFKGQDAVVLSLNWVAEFQHQKTLVDASIEAGVKRLIPSIWGGRLDIPEARDIFPLTASKSDLLEYVKFKTALHAGWSYTAVNNGLFHDL